MEDEESIISASEYIISTLNDISNFDQFIEYKKEIIKAVYDIINSITNIIKIKTYNTNNYNNQQNQINRNNVNPSSISSMLGLKYNYDAYLNNIQLKNSLPYETPVKFGLKNINNKMSNEEIIRNINSNNNSNINTSSKNNNNISLISFKDESNNFFSSQNNDNNIYNNKNIMNKIKTGNNNIDNIINTNTNSINKITESIRIIKNNQVSSNRKDKLSIIADIIMKINSEDYFYEILTKLFGEDLTDKLMASDVSDELLDEVLRSIKEIEEAENKEDLIRKISSRNNIIISQMNPEEMEEQPKRLPIEQILSNSANKINSQNNNRVIQVTTVSSSSYGNYIEPSLQKSGMSISDEYKK